MDYKEIELNNRKLRVYANGEVLVKRCNRDEYYKKADKDNHGYRQISLYHERVSKDYSVHRIVAYAYLGLDIENPDIKIDHINHNKKDNCVENLRLCTNQQNQFNTNARGYTWIKQRKKWCAQIRLNGKLIYIGRFKLEEDASKAYQEAKLKYHIIPPCKEHSVNIPQKPDKK
jgi:hypothetical protein